jgi:uncharacterized protein involved in exopolysaccharide biosynthesis
MWVFGILARLGGVGPVYVADGAKGRYGMKTLWITFLFAVVGTLVAGVATAQMQQEVPRYSCSAVLDVCPPFTSVLDRERPFPSKDQLDCLAARCALLIKSQPVVREAANSEQVRNTIWFKDKPDSAAERLAAGLAVSYEPGTGLITISMTGARRNELPDLVNAVAQAAVVRSTEIANRQCQDRIRMLRMERTSLADTRDRVRADKAKLLREAPTPDPMDPNGVLILQLRRLAEAVSSAEMELSEVDASIQLMKQWLNQGEASSLPQVAKLVERDPVVCGLLMKRAEIAAGLGPRGPATTTQPGEKDALPALDLQIAARKQDVLATFVKSMQTDAEYRKARTLSRLAELRQKYRLADVSVRDQRANLSAFCELDRQDKTLTNQIDRIDNCLVDLRMLLQGKPLEIMIKASTPPETSAPK